MSEAIELAAPALRRTPSRRLVIVCALLSSAARFVPVPFLDDILRERIRQYLVSRLLRAAGRSFGSKSVAPLWRDDESWTSGCLVLLWKVPLKLLLFPIRKIIAIVGALHGLSGDLSLALLLGRALEQTLARGFLAEGSPPATLNDQAIAVRRAFDQAAYGVDLALLSGVLGDALRGVRGLPRALARAARSLGRATDAPTPEAPASESDRRVIDQGAGAVEHALERPEVVRVLSDFDARFAAALPTSG